MLSSLEWTQLHMLRQEAANLKSNDKTITSYVNENEKTVVEQYLNRRIKDLEKKKLRQ